MKFAICNSLSSSLSSTTIAASRSSQLVVANLLASICTCFLFNIEDLASVFKVAHAAVVVVVVVAVVIASVVAGNWSNNHANHS